MSIAVALVYFARRFCLCFWQALALPKASGFTERTNQTATTKSATSTPIDKPIGPILP